MIESVGDRDKTFLFKIYFRLSPMPSNFRIGLDRQVPRHHARKVIKRMYGISVGGMVNSLCSAENRLQAQTSNFLKQVTKTISLEDFFRYFLVGGKTFMIFKTCNNFSLFKYILI